MLLRRSFRILGTPLPNVEPSLKEWIHAEGSSGRAVATKGESRGRGAWNLGFEEPVRLHNRSFQSVAICLGREEMVQDFESVTHLVESNDLDVA